MDNENKYMEVFNPIQASIERARVAVHEAKFDYENAEDNKAARSLVARVRKMKAPLNEAHKTAKEKAKAVCDILDAEKRKYMAQIEELIEVHAGPLKEIEDREAKRIEQERLEKEKREAEERQRLEALRIEMERKEAELKAREDALNREKEKAAFEERARAEAEQRAARLAEEAIEREKKAAEQRIEAARIEAEQKIEDERKKAEMQRAEEQEKARAESERQKAEAEKVKREEEARRANTEYIERVKFEAATAILEVCSCEESIAIEIVDAIASGEIPHIIIEC